MPVGAREPGELAELGDAFNDMAGKLQRSQAQQRRFVADVAHELRTPLTAMLAAADGVSSADPDRRLHAQELLVGQTRRLTRIVDDLLEISRFDAGQARLELEPVDLSELAKDAAHTVAPEVSVHVSSVADPVASVDVRRFHTILRNLVGNAVQHGAAPVQVRIDGRGDDVSVTVADEGPGVPAELASTIFERFVRGDRARTNGDGQRSTGLGLAIAHENAALHGGSITLAGQRRTAFTVRIPRHP
jgi:two-component system sensor histidine kinase MtrB